MTTPARASTWSPSGIERDADSPPRRSSPRWPTPSPPARRSARTPPRGTRRSTVSAQLGRGEAGKRMSGSRASARSGHPLHGASGCAVGEHERHALLAHRVPTRSSAVSAGTRRKPTSISPLRSAWTCAGVDISRSTSSTSGYRAPMLASSRGTTSYVAEPIAATVTRPISPRPARRTRSTARSVCGEQPSPLDEQRDRRPA